MIGIGALSARKVRDSDEGGFLLAGRTLGPFVGARTIVATGFSGWGFMGSPGVAYEYGAIKVLGNFFFAPPFMLSWLGILGSGTLLAAMIGPVFISTFWQGNVAGALSAMVVGFCTSAGLLTLTDLGWVEGPLIGCLASSACYFAVSVMTRPPVGARAGRPRVTAVR